MVRVRYVVRNNNICLSALFSRGPSANSKAKKFRTECRCAAQNSRSPDRRPAGLGSTAARPPRLTTGLSPARRVFSANLCADLITRRASDDVLSAERCVVGSERNGGHVPTG